MTESLNRFWVVILEPEEFFDAFDLNCFPIDLRFGGVELHRWSYDSLQLENLASLIVVFNIHTVLCNTVFQQVGVLRLLVRFVTFVSQIAYSSYRSSTQHNRSTEYTNRSRA
ncbi:hypothetical protein D3C87_1315780 [compost metagenome]